MNFLLQDSPKHVSETEASQRCYVRAEKESVLSPKYSAFDFDF